MFIYLSGEIHTNWRDEIINKCKDLNLNIKFYSPVTDHEQSDDIGIKILGNEEKNFVNDCLDTSFIGQGSYVKNFEKNFSEFVNCKYGITNTRK